MLRIGRTLASAPGRQSSEGVAASLQCIKALILSARTSKISGIPFFPQIFFIASFQNPLRARSISHISISLSVDLKTLIFPRK
jgi:hypothetical protein